MSNQNGCPHVTKKATMTDPTCFEFYAGLSKQCRLSPRSWAIKQWEQCKTSRWNNVGMRKLPLWTMPQHTKAFITYQTTPYHPLYGSFPKDIQLKLTTHPSFCDNSKLSKIGCKRKWVVPPSQIPQRTWKCGLVVGNLTWKKLEVGSRALLYQVWSKRLWWGSG